MAVGPRRDYAAVAASLGATILDLRAVKRSVLARAIRATVGPAAAQAWLAFRDRGRYDAIVTDGEHVGIPLALLLRFSRSPVKHITIAHRLSAPKKRRFFTWLRAQRRIDRVVLHSQHQYRVGANVLRIETARLAVMPYQVDAGFWKPTDAVEERLVVGVGLEHRDYQTLFRSADGLDAEVIIGAASHWSRHILAGGPVPANVRVGSFDYTALRELYARCAVVVVPLVDIDNQAGVTTILEAMAMGKAVVVTQSLGQTDVVEDRRRIARDGLRPRSASLTRLLAETAGVPVEPTGFYVAPGDATSLRRAITYLLDHPAERARLGRAGRRQVEELFTVERFAERMRALVLACTDTGPDQLLLRAASYG
jgi:glycosyltransferase involved in cell wall biosynthesis